MKFFTVLLFLSIGLICSAQSSINEKAVFLSTAGNPGVFDSAPVASKIYLKFYFKTGGPVRSTPGIFNGRIYFGSGDGFFYCLDAITGSEIWKFNAFSAVHSSPDFGNGKVYFTSRGGQLFCLNAEDGTLVWQLDLGTDLPYKWAFDYYLSSPTIEDNTVFVGSGDGHLYSIDSESGKLLWKFNAGSRIRCKPLRMEGMVIFGDFGGTLHAVDIKTQQEKWTFKADGASLNIEDYGYDKVAFVSSPTASGGSVFVGCRDGFLYSVDFNTGKMNWKFDDKSSWVISSPAVYEGKVFTGTSDGKFINAVDAESGKEVWRTKTENLVWSSASISGGIIYYGDYSGNFFGVNSNDGKVIWNFKTGDIIHSSSVVNNGIVYFGSDDGCLYAVTGSPDKPVSDQEVKRAVYWENIPSAKWLINKVDEFVRDYFVNEGYTLVDSNSLKQFFDDRVKDRLPSVVVLILNYIPANVFDDSLITDPLRDYLHAGGKIVTLGPSPFAFKYNRKTLRLTAIDFEIPKRLFGINYAGSYTDAIRGWLPAYPTRDGKKLGLKDFWLSTSQVEASPNLKILAKDETGFAAAWIKNFGGQEGTGLVQFRVNRGSPEGLYNIYNVAEYGLR